jgi:hypothetical protein
MGHNYVDPIGTDLASASGQAKQNTLNGARIAFGGTSSLSLENR